MTADPPTKPMRSADGRAQARRVEVDPARLEHLYEISKVMTGLASAEQTVTDVLAVVMRAIPLRSAMLLLEGPQANAQTRAFAWHARDVGAAQLRSVRTRSRNAFASLRRTPKEVELAEQGISFLPGAPETPAESPARAASEPLILLPLIVARGHVFGLVALQSANLLDENDLAFINIVVSQLAIAIDRVVISDARQAEADAARAHAQRREIEAVALMTQARNAAELTLERLEFNRAVADGLEEGVLAVDRDARVTLCNRAATELLGWREEELLGSVVHQLLRMQQSDGTPIPAGDDPFSLAMLSASSLRSEEVMFSRGKRFFPVSYTVAPLRWRGRVSGAVLAFQDISDRKEAEEAQRESAELLRLIAESVPDKIFIAKANGDIDYCNEQWMRFTGLSFAAIRESGWKQVVHPADLDETMRRWAQAIASGDAVQFEHRFRRADGVFRWHLGRAEAMRNAEGVASMWIGSNTDIDDQKRAEVEQRSLAEVSARLLSSMSYRDTMLGIARSTVPLLADLCMIDEVEVGGDVRRREVVFADPQKQLAFATVGESFAPELGWQTPQAKALASGLSFLATNIAEHEIAQISHDDEHAQFMRDVGVRSMIVVPLLARGKSLGAITFITAESERRYDAEDLRRAQRVAELVALAVDNVRLYDEAKRASSARDDLLAVVAHDLRNPLGAIIMTAAHALMRPAVEDRRSGRKGLEMVRRAADRMNRLISDLVDNARFESGRASLHLDQVPLIPLLDEVLELHRRAAEEKSLRLEGVPPNEPLAVSGDRDRLLQVFGNLLGNAIKFSTTGTITVRMVRRDDEVVCSVADTGPGMEPEEVPHVFDRYWQAKRTAHLGSGLGLSIVKTLVQAHGGRVWAESVLGAGSTFWFSLPLSTALDGRGRRPPTKSP